MRLRQLLFYFVLVVGSLKALKATFRMIRRSFLQAHVKSSDDSSSMKCFDEMLILYLRMV